MSDTEPKIYDFSIWSIGDLKNLEKQVGVAIKKIERGKASKLVSGYSIGERIFLSHKLGEKTFGTITKINSYSVRIKFDHGQSETWDPRFLFKLGINNEGTENVIPFRQRRV